MIIFKVRFHFSKVPTSIWNSIKRWGLMPFSYYIYIRPATPKKIEVFRSSFFQNAIFFFIKMFIQFFLPEFILYFVGFQTGQANASPMFSIQKSFSGFFCKRKILPPEFIILYYRRLTVFPTARFWTRACDWLAFVKL